MRRLVLAAASLIWCTLLGTPSFAQSYYSVVEIGVSGNTIWVDVVPHPNGVDTCGGVPLPCWQAFASLDVQPCPLNTTCSGGTYSDNRYADSNGSGSNIFAVARLALDVNETYTIDGFYHIDYWPPGPECMNGPPYCANRLSGPVLLRHPAKLWPIPLGRP